MAQGSAPTRKAPPHLIERPRLTGLLEQANARIVLLTAPAGYGKTTLARQWLTNSGRSAVWYRATRSSVDVAVLASGLAHATAAEFGFGCKQVAKLLQGVPSPNDEAIALGAAFAEDLTEWPRDAWLVLDDHQTLSSSQAAEDFVQTVVGNAAIQVILTGRERPRWISTRDILYGDVFELGKSVLAMTHAEAANALRRSSNSDHLAGLVALAEGWPAVIGLAALTSGSVEISEDDVPDALYDFFAEELYRELNDEFRKDICELALVSNVNLRISTLLFGSRSGAVLKEAERCGFLTRHESQYELHPLLRQFLLIKLTEFDQSVARELAAKTCHLEIAERNWDDAVQLADRFGMVSLLFEVIEASLDDVLAQGRIASLERWLQTARDLDPASPTISLAEMELCFRRRQWDEARSHAMRLTTELPSEDPRLSHVLHRLGQIGHLDDHYEDALSFLGSARINAKTTHDLRAALWSQFLAVSDHGDRSGAREILRELSATPDASADDLLRLSQGELHLAARWGGVESELKRQSGVLSLIEHSVDPLVRTGFLQTYATALLLVARYEDAKVIAEKQVAEAKNAGLEWVTPHALELLGAAQWGLREFEPATSSLREAYRLSGLHSDLHGQINTAVLLARTYLAQGAPERALEATDLRFDRLPGPSMQGDFLSVRALGYACSGEASKALELADASEGFTDHIESRVIRAFVRAIVELKARPNPSHPGTKTAITMAFREAHMTENYDAFVLSYRAYPAILPELARVDGESEVACRNHIPEVDRRLAERGGLKHRSPSPVTSDPLTAREQEVLRLIRSGLSNREIGRTLWIAESTVKVHVRNILRKLGARTRTEAVAVTSKD